LCLIGNFMYLDNHITRRDGKGFGKDEVFFDKVFSINNKLHRNFYNETNEFLVKILSDVLFFSVPTVLDCYIKIKILCLCILKIANCSYSLGNALNGSRIDKNRVVYGTSVLYDILAVAVCKEVRSISVIFKLYDGLEHNFKGTIFTLKNISSSLELFFSGRSNETLYLNSTPVQRCSGMNLISSLSTHYRISISLGNSDKLRAQTQRYTDSIMRRQTGYQIHT
jgi:hypothetical protein